ncbi:phosphatidate cytidylyltransferase [Qipengyuania sp. 6B39]|uniref:phosphatidate cytidylyltransferase n=1 Tax=Qipengyuania proteolytica TaxID=2867239 RepID=UPI001C8A3E14|nr:phosphatidate cytidylyltransferase [Qipengyuania proteolytica]MBX7495707.1 phosphatidate cytidylyltransferase [Qipengyuania proteolytica]
MTATAPAKGKNADLPVRLASAVVMIAVAVGALWAGDPWLDIFIVAVVLAVLVEFVLLVVKATPNVPYRLAAILGGAVYIGLAGLALTRFPVAMIVAVIGAVVFVDTFAYFFGRTLGGPKIAPAISPSKTWAGLLGGIVGASIWIAGWVYVVAHATSGSNTMWFEARELAQILGMGAAVAVTAQAGDFFESWLKRKAGVKDSSRLIPGHGGVFDRTDGMIPVALLAAAFFRAAL